MTSPLHVAFVPLARPTFDIPLAQEVTDTVRAQLQNAGFALSGPGEMIMALPAAQQAAAVLAEQEPDLLLILQSTFADSTMVVALAKTVKAPVLLWAVPEKPSGGRLRLNSLCGVNLAAHALTLRQRKYDFVYAEPDDTAVLAQIDALARAGRVRRRLQQATVGVIGHHPDGMDTCHLDAPALNHTFGLNVHEYPLTQLFAGMESVAAGRIDELQSALGSRVPNLPELAQTPLRGTLSAFAVMQDLTQKEGLDGLAVRCWPEFFEERNCSACGAMSLLNDRLLPAACEADVNGTVTQLILQWCSGGPAFGADLVSADVDNDYVVLWHCGKAPLSMADPEQPVAGGIHSNRKVPLVMEFPLKPGRVTVARLSRAQGELRLVIGSGEMLRAPKSFSGTCGSMRFDGPAGDVLHMILAEGLEHHVAITYGNHAPALLALANLLNLPTLILSTPTS